MKRVRVNEGTQVNLSGTIYGGGDLVEAPEDVAAYWLSCGWVEAAAPPKRAAPTRKAATKKAASSGTP